MIMNHISINSNCGGHTSCSLKEYSALLPTDLLVTAIISRLLFELKGSTLTKLNALRMYFYYGIALLSILTSPAWSYSEGAPNDQETCKTLFPGHFTDPQASQPPYTIQVSKQTVKPKQTVTLILRGKTEDDTFKGFMIQARQNEVPIGKFGIGESTDFVQLRTCSNEADTASHKKVRGRSMNEVSFTWTAPDNASGTVSFVGTIVKNRPTFWVANTFAEVTVA